ncbi:hypothetical protein Mmc1_0345 [Magnetococcus marinus MC-1]|uniref:Transmembrane protein n=1 Tax=Magnetococcus marinus (strain ATCC BAA-1437 / JCM 17883 / MC-1) TaxID=156889 RepID=A0L4H8_MAGMM|nr:hypothetical protein [Magnetococcus marinus]ABK42871.1 hypothetical protein Mmc1_0345 [Magnetococcus marinus MC-1]
MSHSANQAEQTIQKLLSKHRSASKTDALPVKRVEDGWNSRQKKGLIGTLCGLILLLGSGWFWYMHQPISPYQELLLKALIKEYAVQQSIGHQKVWVDLKRRWGFYRVQDIDRQQFHEMTQYLSQPIR